VSLDEDVAVMTPLARGHVPLGGLEGREGIRARGGCLCGGPDPGLGGDEPHGWPCDGTVLDGAPEPFRGASRRLVGWPEGDEPEDLRAIPAGGEA